MTLRAQIIDIGDERMLGLCPDGRKVWLRGPAVPGDVVNFAEEGKGGVVSEILEPTPGRLNAPCPHFDACPGCQLQPLPYETQLELKSRKITETLRRLGGFETFDFQGVCPSPEAYGTRNKLDFTVEGPELGYHTAEGLIPIHDCLLGEALLRTWIPPLRDWVREHPEHDLHRLMLRVDGAREKVHLLLRGTLTPELIRDLLNCVQKENSFQSLSIQQDWKAPWVTLNGDPVLRFTLADAEHVLRHDAFFQVHDSLADTLVRCVMAWLAEAPVGNLLDLFCGAGAFTLPAARIAENVLGIDSHPGQGPFLAANLLHGLPRDRRVRGQHWDTVLTDPPRAGMSEGLIAELRQLCPARILYISCNPATLARDLHRLCADGTYSLKRVKGFDLFPQTTHVETLALLVKRL